MALIFTTGTINQADAASLGQAMAEKIRDDVVAHPAWDLVEEFTPAGGQVRWYVLRCLGTDNGMLSDFFVVMGRTLASGQLRIAICETYVQASHTMRHVAAKGVLGGQQMDGFGRISLPTEYVLGTTPFSNNFSTPGYSFWTPSGTATKWWLIVAEDRFTVAHSGAANAFTHVGAFVSLSVVPNAFPLQITGSSDGESAVTRNPSIAGVVMASYGYATKAYAGGGTNGASVALGFEGPWKANDKLQANGRAVAEVGMVTVPWVTGTDYPQVYGYAIGKQKGMRRSLQPMPDGLAFGDAFALNGTLWVPWIPTLGIIFDTGVASA